MNIGEPFLAMCLLPSQHTLTQLCKVGINIIEVDEINPFEKCWDMFVR